MWSTRPEHGTLNPEQSRQLAVAVGRLTLNPERRAKLAVDSKQWAVRNELIFLSNIPPSGSREEVIFYLHSL